MYYVLYKELTPISLKFSPKVTKFALNFVVSSNEICLKFGGFNFCMHYAVCTCTIPRERVVLV